MIKIVEYNSESSKELIKKLEHRSQFENEPILITVREILADVRETGDNAVIKYTRKFDAPDISPHNLQVTDQEIDLAYSEVEEEFLEAINLAKSNIESFHQKQLRNSWITTEPNGTILGHLVRPLRRVGVCVPSVSQLLVSSLIMNVIPAKVAGVEEIAVFMGPKPDGTIDPHMLVTAAECGTREIYKCGGAQAIAAMAYGTNTIAKVDKAVGPGNLYVQVAKKEVHGLIDIDKIAGPSEVLVIADGKANPSYVAADLISQAEHGVDSSAILVTTSQTLAQAVKSQIQIQVERLPRQVEIVGSFN
ncbi:TPA: histidinol dehydrogenase, partial [Candidatus Poribacteria bacterium]|nr:histidinol dehydrogenase [Candidatus Poribacteria bacterium]